MTTVQPFHMTTKYNQHVNEVSPFYYEAFTHSNLAHEANFYTQQTCTRSKLLHTANFYTQKTFTHRSFCTETFLQKKNFYTNLFPHSKLWEVSTHREAFTQRSFYTQRTFYTQKVFTPLHREAFLNILTNGNCSSKTGSWRRSGKKRILKHFLKRI